MVDGRPYKGTQPLLGTTPHHTSLLKAYQREYFQF
uniref:Uncharacterized protein n=1 Tax=Moniliophthora roreri TaxID=221103 RepID=A0A0W0F875_MONRR